MFLCWFCFCFVYFSYGNNWHIYCIWLFIVSFITCFFFYRHSLWDEILVWWNSLNEMCWKNVAMCDSSGAVNVRSRCWSIVLCCTRSNARTGCWDSSMEHDVLHVCGCTRVRIYVGWKQIKQSFSTGFLCFIFNV